MQNFLANLWVQYIAVFLRATLVGWGAALVEASHGAFSADMSTQVIGAVMIVLGIVWSLFEKFLVARFLAQFNFFR